jgi:3'-phosphoadenosine 5'-phosphosulfate (PAPS) 3'-phosphatase
MGCFSLSIGPVYPLSDFLVTIDPLDATQEYTEGLLPYVNTQQCIAVNGRPVPGIVHQPFLQWPPTVAVPGSRQVFGGAPKATATAKATKAVEPYELNGNRNVVEVSRSHMGDAARLVAELFPGIEALVAGGAGYKALLVANGHAGAYLHATISKAWDACAADALIVARAGRFTDTVGLDLVYDPADPVLRHGLLGAASLEGV